jgi:hypothetical protein
MLFWLYWILTAVLVLLTVREIFHVRDWRTQLSAALVLIPFLLRVFLLK